MSDCICGRPKSEHAALISGGELVVLDSTGGLLCGGFREVLPWPTSEGWWWCTNNKDSQSLVEATGIVGRFLKLSGRGWYPHEYDKHYGPARFTKLLEQSPFKSQEGA